MANPIGARKNAQFKAISTAPSFNKTPVGTSTPPLPYPTIQDLGNSVGVVPHVRMNGDPVYVLSNSSQPSGQGDAPGVAKGVKSGTVTGEVKPVKGSGTVRMGKKAIVRKGDPCTMNGGNNPGMYCTTQLPNLTPAAPGSAAARAAPQTAEEESMWERAMDGARSLGKKYQENVSESLHGFAGDAMNKGGTIAAAGGGAALAGGAMALTGVGAAPGAVIAAGGGAVAAVGGGVATVGGVVETVATGADAAAAFLVNGRVPNVVGIATAYAERMVMAKIERVTRLLPGVKREARGPEAKAPRVEKKPDPPAATSHGKPQPAGDGAKVVGSGGGGGRCKLRKYREGCPCGTPHHVIPDHCFKQPGRAGAYYAGAVEHADGLSICVTGSTKSCAADGTRIKRAKLSPKEHFDQLAQHGKIHALMDLAESALGQAGSPPHTASLGQLESAGARSVAQVTGCDESDLKSQLRAYHESKGLSPDVKLRADPFGNAKNLDPKIMGKAARRGAGLD